MNNFFNFFSSTAKFPSGFGPHQTQEANTSCADIEEKGTTTQRKDMNKSRVIRLLRTTRYERGKESRDNIRRLDRVEHIVSSKQ